MRLLFAVIVLSVITSAGVLMLMPKGEMPVLTARSGDVRDFGFGRASPVLAVPRLPASDAIPDRLRLRPGDGRCLERGVLSTALVAGGWCGVPGGEGVPAGGRRIDSLPPASPVHPSAAAPTRGAAAPDAGRPVT